MQRLILIIYILLVTSCELSDQGSAPATIIVNQVATPSYVRSWFAACMFSQEAENQDVICPRHKNQASGDSLLDIYLYQSLANIDWYPAQISPGELRQEVSFNSDSINTYINQDILTSSTTDGNAELYKSASTHSLKKNAPFTLYNVASKNSLYIEFGYELPSEPHILYVHYGDYGVAIDTRKVEDNAVLSYVSPLYKNTVLHSKATASGDHSILRHIAYLEPDAFNDILIEFENTNSRSSSVNKQIKVTINKKSGFKSINFKELKYTDTTKPPGNALDAMDLVIKATTSARLKELSVCTSSCRRVEDSYQLKQNSTTDNKAIDKYTLFYGNTDLGNSSLIKVANDNTIFYFKDMHYTFDDDLRDSNSFLAASNTTGWIDNTYTNLAQAYACGIVQGVIYQSFTEGSSKRDIGKQYEGAGTAECDYYHDLSDASGDIVPVFYEYADTLRYGPYHGYTTNDVYNSEFNLYHPDNSVVKACISDTTDPCTSQETIEQTIAFCRTLTETETSCNLYINGRLDTPSDGSSYNYIRYGVKQSGTIAYNGNTWTLN